MPTSRLTLAFALAFALGAPVATLAETSARGARVEVTFTDPAKFTDARSHSYSTPAAGDAILAELQAYLERRAARRLGADRTLAVTITDIDLAGELEPWRGPRLGDVRIVREVRPARLALTFALKDADGAVVAEGRRDLRNTGFLYRPDLDPGDALRHEKALIDDWLGREFSVAR